MKASSIDFFLVDMDSDEFKLLQEYLIKSHGHTHHLSLKVLYNSVLLSQVQDSNYLFSGPRYLPHRTYRRKVAFRAISSRETQRQRPPPSLARLSGYQLRWDPIPRPSHCPSRGSSEWICIWKRCLSSTYFVSSDSSPYNIIIDATIGRYLLQIRQLLPSPRLQQHRPSSPLRSRTGETDAHSRSRSF